jgi:O-antigen/teichoic acid export membrane protein
MGDWAQKFGGRPAWTQARLALVLRGALVAGNFVILLGMAAGLGLDVFGRLIVVWGIAQIAATLLGFGAPLVLLARLGDGAGLHPRAVAALCLGLPVALALPVAVAGAAFAPDLLDWGAVLGAALVLHLVACLASILRVLGETLWSMALRDGAPMLALGLGALAGDDVAAILWICTAILGALGAVAAGVCAAHPRRAAMIGPARAKDIAARGLWANAVLGMALAQLDIVIGGQFLPPEQIAIYALLRRLANLAALPVAVTSWVSTGAISAAHAQSDRRALQDAVTRAGQAAIWPAAGLGLVAALVLALGAGWAHWPLLALMLAGIAVQVVLAQAMTLASLTGQGYGAAITRLVSVVSYLVLAVVVFAPLDAWHNALAYVSATSLGSAALWLWLWHVMAINTLCLPVLAQKTGRGLAWRQP